MATVHETREEQIAHEATQWLDRLGEPTPAVKDEFSEWVTRSPDHVRHLLQATAVREEASRTLGYPALGAIVVPLDQCMSAGSRDSHELRHLARVVSRLPEPCRHIVTLRKVFGLTQQQIADHLAVSNKTVEEHLGQAIRTLASSFPAGAA